MSKDYRSNALNFIKEIMLSNEIDYDEIISMPKNSGELALLYLLDNNNGKLTSGEISKKLNIQTSRVAALLKALEKKELLTRKKDKEDKRVIIVSITKEGSTLLYECIECLLKKISAAYEILGKEDMEKLKGYIIKLCEHRKEIMQCSD